MDAFDITVEHMQRWATSATAAEVAQARHEVDAAIESLRSAPEWFHFLYDAHASRLEVSEWFRTIGSVLAQVQPPP